MNPQNESTKQIHETNLSKTGLQNESTKQLHKMNLLNTVGQNESTKRIFWKLYGFANPKPRIHMDLGLFKVRLCTKDSSGYVGFVKTGRIFWKSVYESNPRIESIKFANLWSRICQSKNESFWSQDSWSRYKMNPCFYESLIRFPHP
jgi:hypothetical protein